MSLDLVAEYHRLLSQTEEMLALHNEKQWVGVLQRWRGELASATPDFDLRRFDCYRVERTSSRAGVSPAEVQRLFTAHFFAS